jgi:hypothetical protein
MHNLHLEFTTLQRVIKKDVSGENNMLFDRGRNDQTTFTGVEETILRLCDIAQKNYR